MSDKYNVLEIQYKKAGKVVIRGREQDLFSVSWKKIGEANGMIDAKKKFGGNPVLEEKQQ